VVHSVIAVPEGRPVELILRSRDVIHNFWVPQLRFKQDLVPGMMIRVSFTANRPGKYETGLRRALWAVSLPDEELHAGAAGRMSIRH